MRHAAILLALGLLAGCNRSVPTRAGGKPVGHWIEAAQGPDPTKRKEAVFKLGNVGPADPSAFPAVFAALGDADVKVRSEALMALHKFGPEASRAAATLAEMKRADPNAHVRGDAAKAIDALESAAVPGR